MGLEKACAGTVNGNDFNGTALLESDHLRLRGNAKLTVKFVELTSIAADDRHLTLRGPFGEVVLELGSPTASLWANKIRNPKSLIDKLGVKADSKIVLIGDFDSTFRDLLSLRGIELIDAIRSSTDLIFYSANSLDSLDVIPKLRQLLAPTGCLWIVSPKGKLSPVKDTQVIAAARSAGLIDVKVVSFSETNTALKFVLAK